MPEAGQTNVDPPHSQGGSGIRFNPDHFKTTPGIIKIVQVVIGLLCLILASPAYFPGTGFFLFAVVISFLSSIVWIFVYLLSIREALPQIPIQWVLTELVNTVIMTVVLAVGTISQLSTVAPHYGNHWYPVNIAAGELINTSIMTILYAIGVLSQLISWLSYGSGWHGFGANIAAGVFGIFNTLVYAAGAFLLYQEYRQP